MKDDTDNDQLPGKDPEELRSLQDFFTYHLHRIYGAKLRLRELLAELLVSLGSSDLSIAVRATLRLVENQCACLEEIYQIMGIRPSLAGFNSLTRLIEDEFSAIKWPAEDTPAFELSVLSALQQAESLELASLQVLGLAGRKLPAGLIITELIGESIAQAEANYGMLLTLIAKLTGGQD
ncbi:MAG: DUF892 family protein [Hymenobacter sp.]|nr:MAG: DUF892 family protein [Hymenobacter sp.]